jgi:hypothetical protein
MSMQPALLAYAIPFPGLAFGCQPTGQCHFQKAYLSVDCFVD